MHNRPVNNINITDGNTNGELAHHIQDAGWADDHNTSLPSQKSQSRSIQSTSARYAGHQRDHLQPKYFSTEEINRTILQYRILAIVLKTLRKVKNLFSAFLKDATSFRMSFKVFQIKFKLAPPPPHSNRQDNMPGNILGLNSAQNPMVL